MIGIVLSGGGARGAYEVGVLSYVFGELSRRHARVPAIGVVCGSSVGAVNGTFLAAMAHDPTTGIARLADLWYEIDFPMVLGFGFRQVTGLHRVWLGGNSPAGIFESEPLAKLIGRSVPWRALSRNLRRGKLGALTVTATRVATGRPYVFVDHSPDIARPRDVGQDLVTVFRPVRPAHVLASAAIPLVFPPVEIEGELYVDGGLRTNTPISPALHLGSDRLFVVGLSHSSEVQVGLEPGRAPGAPFLFGKVLDAFFLDHVEADLKEVARVNQYMEMGTSVFGGEFVGRMNAEARRLGRPERRPVRYSVVRPSVDLGRIAGDHLRARVRSAKGALPRQLLRLLDVGEAAEADLASFLLFDHAYVRTLVELGRRDAAQQRDELAEFFFDTP